MVYYKDYRLKVTENKDGTYDIRDSKYGGRVTRRSRSKEWVDNYIQQVLSKRNPRLKK